MSTRSLDRAASALQAGVPLQLGIAGLGRVVERYYLAALERCREWSLVAGADVREERRRWLHRHLPEVRAEQNLAALAMVPGLDAVVIATPPDSHSRLAVEALEAGLHVMVEKPMALTAGEARRMADAARSNRRQLRVGFNRRFFPSYRALKERLAALRPVELRRITCRMSFDRVAWNAVSGYLGDEERGGGIVHDVASHQLDLLTWLTGRSIEAVQVLALNRNGAGCRAIYRLRMAEGLLADCEAAHGHGYTESLEILLPARRLVATGGTTRELQYAERARMRARGLLERGIATVMRRMKKRPSEVIESVMLELGAFAEAVRCGTGFSATDARQGVESALVLDACRRALDRPGRWIAVERS